MRVRVGLCLAGLALLVFPSAAGAAFVHTVAPGESLYSVAAADGLSVGALAAANGLSPSSQLVAGQALLIPPQPAAVVTPAPLQPTVATASCDGDTDGDDAGCGTAPALTTASAPVATAPTGGYVVQPGDTLWSLAARAGTTVGALAAANGLAPDAHLMAGSVMRLSGASAVALPVTSATVATQEPQGVVLQGNPAAPPYPTPERLSAGEVGQIGANNGATWALTDAIAWQESGFNNDLVSSADARGIMQILPGTWSWIQHSLDTGPPLAPASATENVRGGAIMLNWLLRQTGGDPALAAAGYFQGLTSVRQHGLYPATQQYVADVMALRARFGGG